MKRGKEEEKVRLGRLCIPLLVQLGFKHVTIEACD